MTGIAALLTVAGVVGTVVLAQQGKAPTADSSSRPDQVAVGSPQSKPTVPPTRSRKHSTPQELEEKTRQIELVLDLPIPLSFPNETPINDVLKYVKQATTTPTFKGIPIYVEPLGLKEAGKSIQSTVQIDRQDVPLKTSLRMVLKQLGQAYLVKDGYLLIDSRISIMETRVEQLDRKLDKVLESLERLERAK